LYGAAIFGRLKTISYYTGCRLKIKLPLDQSADEDAIRQALIAKIPGIDVQCISSPDARCPAVDEAFVPNNHPLAGMQRQDFGSSEMKPVAGQTLFGMASSVLENFK
jgi:hypothetical protein